MKANVTVEDISDVEKKVCVEIPWDQVQSEIEQAYTQLRREVDIKGFRRGKAPRSLLERFYKDRVMGETKAKLMSTTFETALSDHEIKLIAEPVFAPEEIEDDQPFSYAMTVEVQPEVKVSDYNDLQVEKDKLDITDEMVEKRLVELREGNAELSAIEEDRAVRSGDYAVIDYQGSLEGKPFRGGQEENALIEVKEDGAEYSFNRFLIGFEKGKTQKINITYPEDFGRKDLAGKEVEFEVTVNEIKEKVLPELNDEFAKSLGDVTSLADLRDKIREELTAREKHRIEQELEEKVFQALIERNPFQVPRSLIEARMDEMVSDMRQKIEGPAGQGSPSGVDWNFVRQNFEDDALFSIKSNIIIQKICEAESISVEDSAVDAEIADIAKKLNRSAEMIKGSLQKNNRIEQLRLDLLRKQCLDFILKTATIIEREPVSNQETEKPE